MVFCRAFLTCLLVACAATGSAQTAPAQAPIDSDPLSRLLANAQDRQECFPDFHCRLTGTVEIDLPGMTKFNADVIDLYVDPDLRIVASGNVVFSSPEGRISAEQVEFNVIRGTGTFYTANATLGLGALANRAEFGNQDPDVTFRGETIERVSAQSYRLTNGTFTTCVQPTARWEIGSDSITINLGDYAIARNMVLRVKGVPLFYLPIIYYPIRDDDRATGFLLPTYGTSTIRGQAVSNAFFWAMGRSHDMTLFHDWFTTAGQGAGAEYRYAAAAGSYGNFRFYRFGQRERAFAEAGSTQILPARTTYEFRGSGNHAIGQHLRVYERVDYITDLTTKQLYQQNIYQASNATRTIEAGLSGTWGGFSTSALYQRTETFTGTGTSQLYGSTPRVTAAVAPARLGGAPVYVSVNSEYAYLPNRALTGATVRSDASVGRFDVQPRVQAALSRLSFLTVNAIASYRITHYDPSAASAPGVLRRYVSLRTDAIGPVFARIWDTPASGFSERMKHVIEPIFSVDHVTDITNVGRVPGIVDASDRITGGSTRLIYGLNNRFLYRARTSDGSAGSTLEFLTIGVHQTYYLNPLASTSDTQYVSAGLHALPVDLSNVALSIRLSPSATVAATTRLEYDVHGQGLQVITSALSAVRGSSSTSINYSRTVTEPAVTVPRREPVTVSSLGGSTSLSFLQNRVTGAYGITWDISRSAILNQNVGLMYLAQCCGIKAEFQKFKYPVATAGFPVPSDRRFNVSVVLAGLGTFSNFFGAFDGIVGARQ